MAVPTKKEVEETLGKNVKKSRTTKKEKLKTTVKIKTTTKKRTTKDDIIKQLVENNISLQER